MSWVKYKIVNGCAVGILDNGKEFLFDIEDLETISSHRWFIDSEGYPATGLNRQTIRLHILLLGKQPKGLVIDHINRNKLDNRRCNLRVCTPSENSRNASLRINNTSGVTGVYFDKKVKRWRAQIQLHGRTKYVGTYDDYENAVSARKQAETQYYQ